MRNFCPMRQLRRAPQTSAVAMWAFLLGLASVAAAQDPARTVKVTGNLAYVDAAGNSEVSTFAFYERLEWPVSALTLTQTFGGVYSSTEGETTASLWRAGLRGDVPFNRSVSAYGLLAFDRDRFAGISRRVEEGLGLGVRILHGPTDSLSLEGGFSFFQQRSTDQLSSSYTAARSGGRYKRLFSESAYFLQLFEVLPNLDDFGDVRAITESSLVAPLSRVLALRLSLVMRYDSDPPVVGVKRLDRLFTAGLEVTF